MLTYTKVTRHGQITLPVLVRRELEIEEGDIIEISVENDRAVLVPCNIHKFGYRRFSFMRASVV